MSAPLLSDPQNTLWFKLAEYLSAQHGGEFAPRYSDSSHVLTWKVAKLIVAYGL